MRKCYRGRQGLVGHVLILPRLTYRQLAGRMASRIGYFLLEPHSGLLSARSLLAFERARQSLHPWLQPSRGERMQGWKMCRAPRTDR